MTEPADHIDPAPPRRAADSRTARTAHADRASRTDSASRVGGLELPARVFDHSRVWRLEEAAFVAAARLLADHVGQVGYRSDVLPDAVVGIARGGVPLARRLGALLGVPAVTVPARHNHSDALYVAATGEVTVPELPRGLREFHGGRLVVADDICGTGATLAAVTARLTAELEPSDLYAVVLCRNAARDHALAQFGATAETPVVHVGAGPEDDALDGSGARRPVGARAGARVGVASGEPDAWLWDTRDWVVFDWDALTGHPTEPLPYPVTVRTPANLGGASNGTSAGTAPGREASG